MNVTDDQINRWAQAISETEETRCQNALSQVTSAVRERFGNSVTVIQQGSHRNRTNIRADSDVDLAVVHHDYFFPDTSQLSDAEKTLYNANRVPASYPYENFKSDLNAILCTKFGSASVDRRNKCIRVEGNTGRVSADVVPAYEYHRFSSVNHVEAEGIALKADSGDIISSFPEQHYANGVKKNDETNRTFKAVVRIFKNGRNEMVEKQLYRANGISSFFIECLVWNVPTRFFEHNTYREDARAVALEIWSAMRETAKANSYAEVSDLKWLFRGQARTPGEAEEFALKIWSYLEP